MDIASSLPAGILEVLSIFLSRKQLNLKAVTISASLWIGILLNNLIAAVFLNTWLTLILFYIYK